MIQNDECRRKVFDILIFSPRPESLSGRQVPGEADVYFFFLALEAIFSRSSGQLRVISSNRTSFGPNR